MLWKKVNLFLSPTETTSLGRGKWGVAHSQTSSRGDLKAVSVVACAEFDSSLTKGINLVSFRYHRVGGWFSHTFRHDYCCCCCRCSCREEPVKFG